VPTLAVFVTPHGFGHAARASAVLAVLARLVADLRLELWTTVPAWFFAESLPGVPLSMHAEQLDVGLVQTTSLAEDLAATASALEALVPPSPGLLDRLAAQLRATGCTALLADITPLGIAVARHAGIPSILVESFSWDWIYAGYLAAEPRLARLLPPLRELRAEPGLWIQTDPVCEPAAAAIRVGPVARRPRSTPAEVRRRLGVPGDPRPLVLLTMGGVGWDYGRLDAYRAERDCLFVVPGGAATMRREENLVLLPHHSPIHHPDLVATADVVAGKLGYSTVAEAWQAGTRLAYVPRPAFRESAVLEAFVDRELVAAPIGAAAFADGTWCAGEGTLAALLGTPRRTPAREPDGAAAAAALIARELGWARGGEGDRERQEP
jgi:hypothetical protein